QRRAHQDRRRKETQGGRDRADRQRSAAETGVERLEPGQRMQHAEPEQRDPCFEQREHSKRMGARADKERHAHAADTEPAHERAEQYPERRRRRTDHQGKQLKPDDLVDQRRTAARGEQREQGRENSIVHYGYRAGPASFCPAKPEHGISSHVVIRMDSPEARHYTVWSMRAAAPPCGAPKRRRTSSAQVPAPPPVQSLAGPCAALSAPEADNTRSIGMSKSNATPPGLRYSMEDSRLFRLLVESERDYAIFMLDSAGRVASWNAGAQAIKGYTRDEIIGRHFSCFYPKEQVDRGWPDYELTRAAADGRFEDESWRVRKDGSRFWANVVITALRDANGELIGFSKVTRDLTERRQQEESLRQSEERFRTLVEHVYDYAIFMLNPEGFVTTWNTGARQITGYEPDEIIGSHLSRFYPPEAIKAAWPEHELRVARMEGRFEDEGWR